MASTSPLEVPVVDFANWRQADPEERLRIAKDITTACQKLGFVHIINHAIPPEVLNEALSWSKGFFDLPAEEKLKAPQADNPSILRGYSSQVINDKHDRGLPNSLEEVTDFKERYDMGSDEDKDQPNVWIPEQTLPRFRPFMNKFYWECFGIAGDILRAIALGLGLEDQEHLIKHHGGNNNRLELLHYPPASAETLRIPKQTDWGTMTMRYQGDYSGLEIEDIDSPGTFIPVPPVKNAIMLNIGDVLQRWSNDQLKSTPYRVTLAPRSDRYAILYLLTPDPEVVIECLPGCGGPDNPPKYHPITQSQYYRVRSKMRRPSKAEVGGGGITNYAPY
ncbi:hypothetical protein FQN54_002057 [Arachnomyces sp. PD_36]|nr:hypothetical protein FQN54_002057 [Arachnomyces sp. PD_36]